MFYPDNRSLSQKGSWNQIYRGTVGVYLHSYLWQQSWSRLLWCQLAEFGPHRGPQMSTGLSFHMETHSPTWGLRDRSSLHPAEPRLRRLRLKSHQEELALMCAWNNYWSICDLVWLLKASQWWWWRGLRWWRSLVELWGDACRTCGIVSVSAVLHVFKHEFPMI